MARALINANPVVYEKKERRGRSRRGDGDFDEYAAEIIHQLEIFDHIRDIKDPEHPYSLEELKVITEDAIEVDDNYVGSDGCHFIYFSIDSESSALVEDCLEC